MTIKSRAAVVTAFGRYLEPRKLTEATQTDLILWLDNAEWSAATRRTYHANLSAFYGWCVRNGYMAESPLRDTRKPKIPRRPPRDVPDAEFAAALEQANPRTRVWLTLARRNGLRAIEIASLRPEDINWTSSSFLIHGKGGADAVLRMHPDSAAVLRQWIDEHGETWDVTPDSVSHAGNYALRRVGSGYTFHSCRHAFAMQLYDQTRDIALVSRALRHASVATTAIYAQTRDDQLSDAIGAMAS
jgi:integrase